MRDLYLLCDVGENILNICVNILKVMINNILLQMCNMMFKKSLLALFQYGVFNRFIIVMIYRYNLLSLHNFRVYIKKEMGFKDNG